MTLTMKDYHNRLTDFFNEFENEKGELVYREKIRELKTENKQSLWVSYTDILRFDLDLADDFLEEPEELLKIGNEVVEELLTELDPEYAKKVDYVYLRITDLSENVPLREMRSDHLEKLSSINGIVIGVTESKPLIVVGYFKCMSCLREWTKPFHGGIYSPPYQCPNEQCARKGSIILVMEKCTFIDWQKITMQEKPEELPPGQLPRSAYINIYDDLVDVARPGDRVTVVGVLKAHAGKTKQSGQLATYSKFIKGVSINKEQEEYKDVHITEEEEEEIKELSTDQFISEKIRSSIAPSIYGHDLVKEAIALLLFGGVTKETPDGSRIRGESNVLMVGDPGVGKSQLLKYVATLAPRALYTSGKGSSAAGLTAAVMRDQDTGEMTLEAGALVLADQGIAMIDEFDKMRKEDQTAIHEAMEQHTISIAKAGIVATLNARASILAAANPRYGRWNRFKDPSQNLTLPSTILSRFDLIFVLEDTPDAQEDEKKATHILDLHRTHQLPLEPPISKELLRKYIAYARKHCHPVLSTAAQDKLKSFYMELRESSGKVEDGKMGPIAITPRQLEALIRLAEARAKLRLSDYVDLEDATVAVTLMEAALSKIARDPETGKYDVDKISSDVSSSSRRRLERIDELIDQMLDASDGESIAVKDIVERAAESDLKKKDVQDAIDRMTRRGTLFEPQPGHIKKP